MMKRKESTSVYIIRMIATGMAQLQSDDYMLLEDK